MSGLLRNRTVVRTFFGALVVMDVVLAYLRTARTAPSWMIFFEDDFFYYLKIAENLSQGHGSTFNGLVATNGYHPLWLLVLTGLSAVSTSGHFILLSVVGLVLLSAIATYVLSTIVLEEAGASLLVGSALAAYVAIYALHVFYSGMEIILAVPMMLVLTVVLYRREYWQRGLWQAFALGLVISITILSRLDLILFVGLLGFWAMVNPTVRAGMRWSTAAGVALGLFPVALYLFFNHHYFGTLMPISGMAKELRFSHLPSPAAWRSIYGSHLNDWVALLPIQIALLVLPFAWKSLNPMQRVLFPALLIFQPIYVFVLSCLSDWRLWGWYRYPSRAGLCAAFAVFCVYPGTQRLMRNSIVAFLAFLAVFAQVRRADWTSTTLTIYEAADDVSKFEQSHTGVYAMGDKSGMVGYKLSDPVVQTEGLVMDKAYLDRVRSQEPLLDALAAYNVRYYIATIPVPADGCFHAFEPVKAGGTSAHLRSDLCHKPVATFVHGEDITTVYDLDQEQANLHARSEPTL